MVVTCPVCEERIDTAKLKPVTAKPILLKLAAIQVRCPTCNQATDRDSLGLHVSQCPSDCPNKCGEKVSPCKQEEHERTECMAMCQVCDACQQSVQRRFLRDHSHKKFDCPIDCPNGCGEKIKPKQLEEHTSSSCGKSVVKCTAGRFCTWSGLRYDLNEHVQSCAIVKLSPFLTSMLEEHKTMLEVIATHEAHLKAAKEQLALTNSKYLSLQEQVDSLKSQLYAVQKIASVLPVRPEGFHSARLIGKGVRIDGFTISAASSACDAFRYALADTSVCSGVHYWEVTKLAATDCYSTVGVVDGITIPDQTRIGTTGNSWGIRIEHNHRGFPQFTGAWNADAMKDFPDNWPYNCVIGLLLDADSGRLTVYKDGVMVGVPFINVRGSHLTPAFAVCHSSPSLRVNFTATRPQEQNSI
ncbi:hypothetical protein Pelo_1845 [Pelomyxa schiedti]|nr:hypothetical protein Pelo_1845 [Pelomyxa schiedti]